jgi:hypothetical protein
MADKGRLTVEQRAANCFFLLSKQSILLQHSCFYAPQMWWAPPQKIITAYSALSAGWFWSKNVLMLQMCISHIPSLSAFNS